MVDVEIPEEYLKQNDDMEIIEPTTDVETLDNSINPVNSPIENVQTESNYEVDNSSNFDTGMVDVEIPKEYLKQNEDMEIIEPAINVETLDNSINPVNSPIENVQTESNYEVDNSSNFDTGMVDVKIPEEYLKQNDDMEIIEPTTDVETITLDNVETPNSNIDSELTQELEPVDNMINDSVNNLEPVTIESNEIVNPVVISSNEKPESNKKNNKVLILILILVLAAIIIGLVYYFLIYGK